jgi:MFS family permease
MLSDRLGRVRVMRLALLAVLLPGLISALAPNLAVLVVLLALVEGGVILGFSTYLPPSLETAGYGSAVAGLAVGLYGLATLAWTCVLKRASDGLARYALHLIGGVLLAWGYTAGALDRHLAGAVLAAVLVAGGFAFMHSESPDQCQASWVVDASEQLGYPWISIVSKYYAFM